jgi:deoxyribodipyrimidine photo-lyase
VAAWTEDGLWSAAAAAGGAGERVGLWLHAEDLAVEVGELAGENVASVNAVWPTGIAGRAGWGEGVADWTRAALGDGATRAGAHFGVVVMGGAPDELAAELVEWAQTQGLRRVVAYRPCIGPWLDEGLAAERALGAAGIALTWRRRAWDTELFPHAGRGYFPFWERVKAAG